VLGLLRRSLTSRLVAPALLLGLALGVAGPVRAAQARVDDEARLAALLADADAARVERALRTAAAQTSTADDFAREVTRLLVDGTRSPARDALLETLFGRLFQALRLEHGTTAVLVATSPVPHLGPPAAASLAPALAAASGLRVVGAVRPDAPPAARPPRVVWPGVQPLGP